MHAAVLLTASNNMAPEDTDNGMIEIIMTSVQVGVAVDVAATKSYVVDLNAPRHKSASSWGPAQVLGASSYSIHIVNCNRVAIVLHNIYLL